MNKIIIDYLDLNNTLFHFDIRDEKFIEKNGFPPDIGPDSKNAEKNPKVFFSKGVKGVLDIIDVWIIWRMNKEYCTLKGWSKEFLNSEYLHDKEKKEKVFGIMYEWLIQRKYYKVDLLPGIDYLENDIDEAKQSALQEKNEKAKTNETPWKFLYAYEMYKGKIKHKDATMEDWNMHTIVGKGISPDKISLIQKKDGVDDALSIIEVLYGNYSNKHEFRLLNEFIKYCKMKKSDDIII